MRAIFIILLFTQSLAQAVTNAPVVLRACFNLTDSIVTVSWTNINDGCGSFTKLSLYENVDGGTFSKITDIADILATSYSFKTPDIKTDRNYYLQIHTLCDFLDSAQSNITVLDQTRSSTTELDSVSYDFVTQNIIAGWSSNKDDDHDGYRLLKQKVGIFSTIGETVDTFYTISTDPKDVFYVALSAYDSCGLYSLISDTHRVCRVNSAIDTCKREITLSWSPYVGWNTLDSQVLLVSKNFAPYGRHSSFPGNISSYVYTDFILGDTICFMIRAYSSQVGVTSTSNISCIESRAFHVPSYLYLSNVTVDQDVDIELTWSLDDQRDIREYDIWEATGAGGLTVFATETRTGSTTQTSLIKSLDVHANYYTFQTEAKNFCGESVIVSNTANSIYLDISSGLLHNSYINWDGGVMEYQLFYQKPNSSTWNAIDLSPMPISYPQLDSSGCYYIQATENLNQYGLAANSVSNIECILPQLSVYVPNSIVMNGVNNRFIVLGAGIDHSMSNYQIFNRWGEMLVDRSTREPWYGDYMGTSVMPGVYVYVVTAVGFKGEKQVYKGVLRIIESN